MFRAYTAFGEALLVLKGSGGSEWLRLCYDLAADCSRGGVQSLDFRCLVILVQGIERPGSHEIPVQVCCGLLN